MDHKNSQSPAGIPLKVRFVIGIYTYLTDVARRPDGTTNRLLLEFIDLKAPPSSKLINGITSSDIVVDPTRELWFRLYTPSDPPSSQPLLVYFHGGGFNAHKANSAAFDGVCHRLARELPAVVVSVNYRRSPEYRFPCQYEDGIDILKFLDESVRERSTLLSPYIDVTKCFLVGDSAGANLAHHVAVRATSCSFQKLRVVGLVGLQPFFGGEERTESELRLANATMLSLKTTDWMWKAFLPEGTNRDHEAANVSGPNRADISAIEFPATLLIVGGYDLLQDWQRRYYEWLKESGKNVQLIEYPNVIHGFYAFPEFPESTMAIMEVKSFIQKQVSTE